MTAKKYHCNNGLTLVCGTALALLLAGCGGGGGDGSTPPVALAPVTAAPSPAPTSASLSVTALAADPVYRRALDVWRAPRVKGECMSCHGPDFFDLARIGSPDSDIVRRATIDGATAAEAQDLIAGIKLVRSAYRLAPENPRTFRPLQPGGAVLPGASSIERDLALAGELRRVTPTLANDRPIRTLAEAQRARDELLALDFGTLRIGIPFPIWSTDRFHSVEEGNLNDWVADVARLPHADRKAEWLAVQDAYLADPSDLNFWRVYFALPNLTQPFAELRATNANDVQKINRIADLKLRNALVGQHILRTEALGRRDAFMRGPVAFAYLTSEEPFRTQFQNQDATGRVGERLPRFLPNPIWELGDYARFSFDGDASTQGQLGNISSRDLLRDRLTNLGYPQFVVDSVDPALTAGDSETAIRTAWFFMGLRFDPGLQRISQSNATLVGEYLQADLQNQDYFIHRVLVEALRQTNRVFRPEASFGTSPPYRLYFGYFAAYNRAMPSRWNSPGNASVDAATKAAQIAAYKPIAANFFRMSLLLHEQELVSGRIAPYGPTTQQEGNYKIIQDFFAYAGLPDRANDDALIARVAARSNTPI